jgi:hypothetical protein
VLALQVQGLGELPGVHRGGAQVAYFACLDQVVQCLEGLLERCRVIVAVDLVKVDTIRADADSGDFLQLTGALWRAASGPEDRSQPMLGLILDGLSASERRDRSS